MRKERIEAEVEFRPKGLGRLKAQWLDFAGDLLEPVALLAAGATKAQAAWAGLRGVFLTRVLGPIGMVAGAATGLLLTIGKLTKEWGAMGIGAAANLERLTLRFRPLLGTMDLAKQRVKELVEFTAKTPFRLGEVAEANQLLQALTKGALASKDAMTLVGDSAARAGAGFVNTARYVGRLYDGLMNGRPVGEATMRLQELSLISGATRNKIESMQAANVSGNQIWAEVEKELKRNQGAMKEMSEELSGLESTYSDVKEQLQGGFSKGFREGEKESVKSMTKAMERMQPVAEFFGEIFGSVSNTTKGFKARMLDAVTSVKGFEGAVKVLGLGALTVLGGVVMATGWVIGRFVVGVLSASAASAQLAKVSASVAVAEKIEDAVSRRLMTAKLQLVAAKAAVTKGSYAEAAGAMRVAVSETVAASKTSLLATSQIVLRGALMATVGAMKWVVSMMAAMVVSIATNPWLALATALLAAGAALWNMSRNARKAREELEAYRKTTEATTRNLESQRRALQSVADLRQLEAKVVRELAGAYRELEAAKSSGDRDKGRAAAEKVAQLEAEQGKVRAVGLGDLERPAQEVALGDYLREREREARMAREDYATGGAEGEQELARKRLAEQESKAGASERDRAERERTQERRDALRREQEDARKRVPALLAERAKLQTEAERIEANINPDPNKQNEWARGQYEKQAAVPRGKMAEIDAELAGMRAGAAGGDLQAGLESRSELDRLRSQIALYDSLVSAADNLKKAKEDLSGADEGNRVAREEAVREAEREESVLKALAEQYGTVTNYRQREDANRKVGRMETEEKEALDPQKLEEARQKARDAEMGVLSARLDAEARVAALRLRGREAEEAMLGYERQKLEAARERGRIGDEEYRRQRDILQAREDAQGRDAREAAQRLQLQYEQEGLERRAEMARRAGDPEREAALRKAADERADALRRQALEGEARDVTSDPAAQRRYVESRMEESRAARREQRGEEERDRSQARRQKEVELDSEETRVRAQELRRQGRSKEARRIEEEADRRRDDAKKGRLEREYREMGFGKEEAGKMAGREVRLDQVGRLMDRFSREGGGRVVASSLAKIGGGGGVAGRDPNTALLDQIRKLMEKLVEKNDDVDFPVK